MAGSKVSYSLGSTATIREAIQKIAWQGIVNPESNTLYDVGQIVGFVKAIHTDGELAGTVDVQEYTDSILGSVNDEPIGLHTGVSLSALQDNRKGYVIIPKLYSDVVIVRDPDSGREYVTMFSHVDLIQLDSHDQVTIQVKEREDFDPSDEDGPDIEELEETGVHSQSIYKKDSITTEVTDGESNTMTEVIDTEKKKIVAGDDKSIGTIAQDKIQLEHDDSKMALDDDKAVLEKGSSKVQVEDGTVYLGSNNGTDDAVLGSVLADVLMDIVGYLSQAQTTTMMGPQPLITQVPNFIAMKAKIQAWKSAHSGFLTQKVQVQK